MGGGGEGEMPSGKLKLLLRKDQDLLNRLLSALKNSRVQFV